MNQILLFTALVLISNVYGQSTKNSPLTVSNVRVELDIERVKIVYDVTSLTNSDSVYIQVESRKGGFLRPKTVTGDVGKVVSAGVNKTIYWDYRLDGVPIDDEIRVTVLVKPHSGFVPGGGPVNALVSALVPGLGTIFVQPNHKIGWRPAISATYVGLLVYGLVQRSRSKQLYKAYESQTDELQAEPFYADATQHHQRYLVATRIAAAVWVTDVVYTFLKGLKNEKRKHESTRKVAVGLTGKTPTLGVQLRF